MNINEVHWNFSDNGTKEPAKSRFWNFYNFWTAWNFLMWFSLLCSGEWALSFYLCVFIYTGVSLKSKHLSTTNGSDLEINKIYTVTNTKMIDTQKGKSMILSLFNNGDIWAPEHLKNKILNSDCYYNPPFYIRPLGLKPCKNKSVNKYHAIEITHV